MKAGHEWEIAELYFEVSKESDAIKNIYQ